LADRPTLNCGFIGMGSQGAPMAQRMIDAGFAVTLWARRAQTLDRYRNTCATFAATIPELGAAVDHVGVCVVDDNDVREVCNQLIPAMRPGSLIAIHSTIHPETCQALARQAGERGVRLIDAPVSGGQPVAEIGELTVMVGGDPAAFEAARPVFESFGKLIVLLGDVGAGQKAKLINNALLTANLGLVHNAVAGGVAMGVDRTALIELLKESSGRSYGLEVYARMTKLANFAHPAMLLAKDVRLLGETLGPEHPAFAVIRDAAKPFLDAVEAEAKG
jgi:3-hydroxyisobutyrate dehydrogenase-like beta-hydroxyacid dehydrogenase